MVGGLGDTFDDKRLGEDGVEVKYEDYDNKQNHRHKVQSAYVGCELELMANLRALRAPSTDRSTTNTARITKTTESTNNTNNRAIVGLTASVMLMLRCLRAAAYQILASDEP